MDKLQFILPWYGLAINRELQPSSWSTFYRRFYSKKHVDGLLRLNDNDEDYSIESQQQLPYMLVEYGEQISSSSSENRNKRGVIRSRPARGCDPKSPCCRRPLIIDFDQDSVFNGSSLNPTQAKNEPSAGYKIISLYRNDIFSNRNATTAQVNKPEQPSPHCCSFSHTGGIEVLYTTTNGGPIIRKYIPNMIVEQCRCGLPATIQKG
jgi:hypothetical protein